MVFKLKLTRFKGCICTCNCQCPCIKSWNCGDKLAHDALCSAHLL